MRKERKRGEGILGNAIVSQPSVTSHSNSPQKEAKLVCQGALNKSPQRPDAVNNRVNSAVGHLVL